MKCNQVFVYGFTKYEHIFKQPVPIHVGDVSHSDMSFHNIMKFVCTCFKGFSVSFRISDLLVLIILMMCVEFVFCVYICYTWQASVRSIRCCWKQDLNMFTLHCESSCFFRNLQFHLRQMLHSIQMNPLRCFIWLRHHYHQQKWMNCQYLWPKWPFMYVCYCENGIA